MAVYLVTWNLNREKQNYAQARANLIAQLQKYDHTRDPDLESVWFLSSTKSAFDIKEDLRAELDGNDGLMVTRLAQGQYAGWVISAVWDWISARL